MSDILIDKIRHQFALLHCMCADSKSITFNYASNIQRVCVRVTTDLMLYYWHFDTNKKGAINGKLVFCIVAHVQAKN